MKRVLIPSMLCRGLATGCGFVLVALIAAPRSLSAFVVTGHDLGLDQRDVRVFDNFQDPEANDNTIPDPNWPGYTGAELAVWKAVCEWGSILHGDGSGDPTQPGDLGSGDSNFDPSWQGNAPDTGGATGNVVSAATSLGGGVVAVSEVGSSGWRIRLNEQFIWDDGPGVPVPGALDIQGVVTREYGFALGLGVSNVAGSTMSSTVNQVSARSLEPDDVAGMQFVYGTQSALKPFVASASGGNPVVITGFAFSPTDNEVWFTRAGANPDGEPLKVTGLASSANGTVLQFPFPLGAGPGDVLVLNSWGRLSNAYPFDTPGCEEPVVYCSAMTTAIGCVPSIGWSGTPSASSPSGFTVQLTGLEGEKAGIFYFGTNGSTPPWTWGTTFQCVAPPVLRTPLQTSGGSAGQCNGSFSYDLNHHWNVFKPHTNPGAGTQVNVQTWFRDPANTSGLTLGTAFSDALELVVCP